MSTSLIVLIPVVLLGIVSTLCFVGCLLDSGPFGSPFTEYTTKTILLNSRCIAYWPLKEIADSIPASELISNNTGAYIDPTTAKPDTIYPWPEYSVPNGANSDVLSAAAPGTIMLGQPGIVIGDVVAPVTSPTPPACMVVNGCYVEVPWNAKFVPTGSFTVEAWVRPDWTADDPHAWRFVLDMREQMPVTTGFGIYAQADDTAPGLYRWAAIIGDGSSKFMFLDNAEAAVTLRDPAGAAGTTVYLTLTYNSASQTLTLFVNGASVGQLVQVGYAPNAAQVLWIGAGSPYVPRRTQPADPTILASPLFPFVGAIQDVAIYNDVLDDMTILTHFNNGNGTDLQ
jgi:hypothetical protein